MRPSSTGKARFRRIDDFAEGNFEEDLLVIHADTQDTVMLNFTAAAIWEALKWPQSVEDLVGLLLEAFPQQPRDELTIQVEEALRVLQSRGLIKCEQEP